MANTSAKTGAVAVVERGKHTRAIRKPFPDLTIAETDFCFAYISNGANATAALRLAKPHLTENSTRVEVTRLLAKPAVKSAIERLLEERYLNKRYIVGKFASLSGEDKPDEMQLRATSHLAKVLGLYGENGGGGGGVNLQVNFNLPSGGRVGKIEGKTIDAEAKDVEWE